MEDTKVPSKAAHRPACPITGSAPSGPAQCCCAGVVAARVRLHHASHRVLFRVNSPAQRYGRVRGAHGKHKGREGPCSAGNSLLKVASDVRRRSPGTAVRDEKLHPA